MGSEYFDLNIRVKATSEDAALELVKKQLGGVKAEIRETEAATSSFSSRIKSLVLSVGAWVAGLALAQTAMRGLHEFVTSSIEEAKKQENANHGLADALRITGQNVELLLPQLMRYAAELQHITGIGDEVSIGIMERLTRFGLEGEALKKTTALILDMKTAGIEERGAVDLLGRAYLGQTQMLARYGIVIREGLSGQEKYNAVLEGVAKLWGGKAAEAAQTFEGRVKKLNAVWGDFKESVGFAITQNPKLAETIKTVTDMLEGQINETKTAEERTAALSDRISSLIIWLAQAGKGVTNFALGLEGVFRFFSDGISKMLAHFTTAIGEVGEIGNKVMGSVFDKIPGAGKIAALFHESAKQAKMAQDVGKAWADESEADWQDYLKRLQSANDGWDKLIANVKKAKAEENKPSSGGGGIAPPGAGGAAASEKEDQSVKALAAAYVVLRQAETAEAAAAMQSAEGKKALLSTANALVAALGRQRDAEKDQIRVQSKAAVNAAKGDSAQIIRIKEAETARLLALDKKYGIAEAKVYQDAQKKQKQIGDKITADKKKDEAQRLQLAIDAAREGRGIERRRNDWKRSASKPSITSNCPSQTAPLSLAPPSLESPRRRHTPRRLSTPISAPRMP